MYAIYKVQSGIVGNEYTTYGMQEFVNPKERCSDVPNGLPDKK